MPQLKRQQMAEVVNERPLLLFPRSPLRLALPGTKPREGNPKGRAAARPFVSVQGEVQEGEIEIPLLPCLLDRARPVFSTGRKWGAHSRDETPQNSSAGAMGVQTLSTVQP